MREGDVRSPVSRAGEGRRAGMEREWGARRGRETTEKRPQWYEEGKCGSERRCGPEGGSVKWERRASRGRGGDKEGGEGVEGTSVCERERERGWRRKRRKKKRRESILGRCATVPSEKEQHAPSNRVDSFQNVAWQGLYQCRCSRIVGHQWQPGIRQSHQPRWQRRVTTALGTVRL